MKRIAIGLIVFFLLVLGLIHLSRPSDVSPRYVAVQTQPKGPFTLEAYSWSDAVPIRDGKMWMWVIAPNSNSPRRVLSFLYDLDEQRVIGQMSNGPPEFANQDQTRLLCEANSPTHIPLKQRLAALVSRISRGKITWPTNQIESYWVLDLRNNSSVWIGNLVQAPLSGSDWHPAPGFRFGYNVPTTAISGWEFFLCDLEKKSLQKISFTGDLRGWWDDHEIVATDAGTNYELFDVINRKTSPLFTKADVTQFLAGQGITNYPVNYSPIFSWNGSNYDFFLTADRRNGILTNTTFLLRVEHDGPRFTLLSRNFQLRWLGYFDASGTHYLYSGESGAPGNGGNGGVYLRDVSNNTDRVLVPPNNGGQYALARFYGNTVVFWRKYQLWSVDINTTNASPILQTPGK